MDKLEDVSLLHGNKIKILLCSDGLIGWGGCCGLMRVGSDGVI